MRDNLILPDPEDQSRTSPLGSRFGSQSLDSANRVDEVCDQFEAAWQEGRRPRIEDFLDDTLNCEGSTLLLELLRLEIEYRSRSGETISFYEYVGRFQKHAEQVQRLEPELALAPTIIQTVAPGQITHASAQGQTTHPSASGQAAQRSASGHIEHFELLEEVGSGTFGTVWKARDTQLNRYVALKIPRQPSSDAEYRRRFLREARAAAALEHKNLVTVHGCGETPESFYIVFSYVDGLNLKEWLYARKNKISCDETARICAQVADGLDYAHQQGIVHRDIKPANILIDTHRQPRVADFGLARRSEVDTTVEHVGMILGTTAYMSPEQADGRADEAGPTSDIYSLGVVLYQMLTGQVPFQGTDTVVTLDLIRQKEPTPPRHVNPAVPRDLETICLKAMAKQPADRYASAGEMAAELRRYLENQPIRTRRTSLPARAWRWIRRNRFAAGMTSVSCALAVVGLGMILMVPTPADGRREILLETDPPGADVYVFPLDEKTGDPQFDGKQPLGFTPVETRLAPGDYLVVAVLDEQRFHEVYRHVPREGEKMPHFYWHQFWKETEGKVVLPSIVIPPAEVTTGMARLPGATFRMGEPGNSVRPAHRRSVPTLFVDVTEATVAQFRQIYEQIPINVRPYQLDENDAIPLVFDRAVEFAERAGKRLPSEAEYEFMATRGGEQLYPWGKQIPADVPQPKEFGPAGKPSWDILTTDPQVPVYGLCSNVAEWTTSYLQLYPPRTEKGLPYTLVPFENIIVRGGGEAVIEGNLKAAEQPTARERLPIRRYALKRGLGVRFVRSARPRLREQDFVKVIPGS